MILLGYLLVGLSIANIRWLRGARMTLSDWLAIIFLWPSYIILLLTGTKP